MLCALRYAQKDQRKSTCAKAAYKIMEKLAHVVNFINILRSHIWYESFFKAKLKAEKSCSKDFCTKMCA